MIYYKVSESELLELLEAANYKCALEAGGVDNWEWEADSRIDYEKWYRQEYPDIKKIMEEDSEPFEVHDNEYPSFYQMAKYELKYYEVIK